MPERQNSTHSPRVDDQLTQEESSLTHGTPVESRSREDRGQEGPIDHAGYRPDAPATPPGFSTDTVELRSAMAASIRPSAFPADRSNLLRVAQAENAPEPVVRLLEQLPDDETFYNVEEVWEEAGGPREPGRGD